LLLEGIVFTQTVVIAHDHRIDSQHADKPLPSIGNHRYVDLDVV
jgi:hypothetical protein